MNRNEQYAKRAGWEATEYDKEAKRERETGSTARAQRMERSAESQRQKAASYRRRA